MINGKIISDNKEVAEILNNYYIESIETLEVERYSPNENIDHEHIDEIDKILHFSNFTM